MRMKNKVLISFLLMSSGVLSAQHAMQNVLEREKTSLNGEWSVLIDPNSTGKKGWHNPQATTENHKLSEVYYEGDWQLTVPGDWNHQMPELFYYEGDMWYKRDFIFTPQEDKRTFVHFGAVSQHCEVFLNGESIGSHKGAFTPFQFEVSDKIKEGHNYIIVKVDNRRSTMSIPALQFDWWNYGGITRDVDLVSVADNYIYDYTIGLKDNKENLMYVEVQLDGEDVANKKVEVEIAEAKTKLSLTTDENGFASATKKANLSLWSPDNPKLYDVVLKTNDETIEDEIGFRTIEVKGEDILLNGKPIFLKGINIHEEIASEKRRSCNSEDARFLIDQAKELGCNFIRLSHYAHNEYMVRLAEKSGMLMWEEIPTWQSINFKEPSVCQYAQDMMTEMIERDKNRCGIILWSISNETAQFSSYRNDCLSKLADYTREIDPTRLVTSALHMAQIVNEDGKFYMELNDPLIEHLDVVGINKYMGWYTPYPCDAKDLNWRIATGKPVIMSEFGSECVAGNYAGDPENLNSWHEVYMSNNYRNNIASFENFPNLRGTAPWILFDFRSPRRPHAKFQKGWNRKGLISPDGVKKQAWYIMRDYYKTK